MKSPYICLSCRNALRAHPQARHGTVKRLYHRPSFAPKPVIDVKHICQSPGLYEQNCVDRNYKAQAKNSWRILELHQELIEKQRAVLEIRRRSNALGSDIQRQAGMGDDGQGGGAGGVSALMEQARALKEDLQQFERWENAVKEEVEALAFELPNLSSQQTPVGEEPRLLSIINPSPLPRGGAASKSHVDIGKELNLLDFEASASTSGWGWYFLKNEGALLEQALVQYALDVARRKQWQIMTPPSMVYGHIASACGFMPRDQNGETQRYSIAGDMADDNPDKPSLVMAGTAEIPFAGSQANKTLKADDLPLKVIGPSRCYRAEAGARGVDTKGLYRVHEFTKVEMFAWTQSAANEESGDRFGSSLEDDETLDQTNAVFQEMLSIQTEIIESLGLHARILEMPTADLGASAARKIDIEAWFPSRGAINEGYGEVTSASICTDYQARRLGTRLKHAGPGTKLGWPHTINGTAMAVPRLLACLLETHWDEESKTVEVPRALRPYFLGGFERIGRGFSRP